MIKYILIGVLSAVSLIVAGVIGWFISELVGNTVLFLIGMVVSISAICSWVSLFVWLMDKLWENF